MQCRSGNVKFGVGVETLTDSEVSEELGTFFVSSKQNVLDNSQFGFEYLGVISFENEISSKFDPDFRTIRT